MAVAPGGHIVDPTKYNYERLRKGVRLYPLGPILDEVMSLTTGAPK
jgi:hypothetical protein